MNNSRPVIIICILYFHFATGNILVVLSILYNSVPIISQKLVYSLTRCNATKLLWGIYCATLPEKRCTSNRHNSFFKNARELF